MVAGALFPSVNDKTKPQLGQRDEPPTKGIRVDAMLPSNEELHSANAAPDPNATFDATSVLRTPTEYLWVNANRRAIDEANDRHQIVDWTVQPHVSGKLTEVVNLGPLELCQCTPADINVESANRDYIPVGHAEHVP